MNVTTNTSFEKWKTKGVTKGYGSLLNSVVSIDPLTPAYISNVEDLAPGMKAQVEAGGPVQEIQAITMTTMVLLNM